MATKEYTVLTASGVTVTMMLDEATAKAMDAAPVQPTEPVKPANRKAAPSDKARKVAVKDVPAADRRDS